jgi:hypothetical protein
MGMEMIFDAIAFSFSSNAPNHIDLYDVEKYVEPALNKTVEWFNKYLRGMYRLKEELTRMNISQAE